jgi:hypothetical protein
MSSQVNAVQAMLAQTSLANNLFIATSRYYGLPTETYVTPQGQTIAYVTRRFVPPPERFQLLQEYSVVQGDRVDNVAARFLGDPELFWRLCDANRAVRPWLLTAKAGRKLRITLPEGITGSSL